MIIRLKKRETDWLASIICSFGKWGVGPTQEAAIGALVKAWREDFGVDMIEFPSVKEEP